MWFKIWQIVARLLLCPVLLLFLSVLLLLLHPLLLPLLIPVQKVISDKESSELSEQTMITVPPLSRD